MTVGALGDIAFTVSADTVRTVDNATWGGSARYGTHQIHAGDALTEYTGNDPDSFTFDIYLSAYLGVSPIAEATKIFEYEREGTPVSLVIGNKVYGKYRWTVTSHKVKMQYYDNEGDVTVATVSVTLQEYLKG